MARYAFGFLVFGQTGGAGATRVQNKAGEIAAMMVGRDPLPEDPSVFGRYVLGGGVTVPGFTKDATGRVVAAQEEVTVMCFCALASNLPAQIRTQIEAQNPIPGTACTITWFDTQTGQSEMQAYMQDAIRLQGYDRVWWITPTTTIPTAWADRLAAFGPI